jgi:hypothetical protein
MPLQDRITPFGEFIATPARGTLMGNRGGRLHDEARRLGARRWVSKQWICCKLDFNNRHRDVWGDGYSELFFLDEVTAFAAGHRPCFECRRHEAERFAALFSGKRQRAGAAQMDRVLHAERLDGKAKRLHTRALDTLPNGAMIARDGGGFAVRGTHLLRWTPFGRRAHAAVDPCRARARLCAALAPKRGLSIKAARSWACRSRPRRRSPP